MAPQYAPLRGRGLTAHRARTSPPPTRRRACARIASRATWCSRRLDVVARRRAACTAHVRPASTGRSAVRAHRRRSATAAVAARRSTTGSRSPGSAGCSRWPGARARSRRTRRRRTPQPWWAPPDRLDAAPGAAARPARGGVDVRRRSPTRCSPRPSTSPPTTSASATSARASAASSSASASSSPCRSRSSPTGSAGGG